MSTQNLNKNFITLIDDVITSAVHNRDALVAHLAGLGIKARKAGG